MVQSDSLFRPASVRRSAAVLALLLMVGGGFELFYLEAYALDRDSYREYLTRLPYRRLPGFQDLAAVAVREIPPEASVAIWIADPAWDRGYEYAYYRSVYLLKGRQSIPLLDKRNAFLSRNLASADYVLCWRCDAPFAPFETTVVTKWGTIARRR